MINKSTAYLLCLLWCLGLGGIHRFYAGKPLSGLIYLFTWGLFGFGQLIDLALIPAMVDEKNLKYLALRGGNQSNTQTVVVNLGGQVTGQIPGSGSDLSSIQLPPQQVSQRAITPAISKQNDIIALLKLAQNKGGSISMADAVIELSKPTSEIRSILETICADGLMEIANHESTGAVIYRLI
ncbi:TM2 domain-containing protein [Dolichospermum sp. ST_con]|nr:TM2 domain-containing protein [Dolichospermum sp. ST_con]MDD1420975.1 TM2 domain-containing protein [Dolichospermum sp. ST_sed1]MDD1427205.1 TM2 domain-containing protein [Dolichospermum sp. ST_sed9]MDD1432185.1 TM2 domain-containing protein [Dolichospermum sp. ST_sed6]MDD1436611.1 TM2 domain-containing protein [Dolichospermum sp. ST_sed10]MDD1442516.1 TM2 domain-containing protein [Dolichospermum sp. ST_sed3]MDD1447685.1 TM2 domain-containing protein [Dolichospermum sp. ST_sed8]MDD145671